MSHLPTPRALTAGGAVAVALVAVALLVTGQVDEATDDLLEIASALLAALSCGLAAGAARGRLRLGRAALRARVPAGRRARRPGRCTSSACTAVKHRGKAGGYAYSPDLEATGSVVPRPRTARSPV